jgi:hypothetical protein
VIKALPILYVVVPYLRSFAQLRGWLEGRRLRDAGAPIVPSEQLGATP